MNRVSVLVDMERHCWMRFLEIIEYRGTPDHSRPLPSTPGQHRRGVQHDCNRGPTRPHTLVGSPGDDESRRALAYGHSVFRFSSMWSVSLSDLDRSKAPSADRDTPGNLGSGVQRDCTRHLPGRMRTRGVQGMIRIGAPEQMVTCRHGSPSHSGVLASARQDQGRLPGRRPRASDRPRPGCGSTSAAATGLRPRRCSTRPRAARACRRACAAAHCTCRGGSVHHAAGSRLACNVSLHCR